MLLYIQFRTWSDALHHPRHAALCGHWRRVTLFVTHTAFSISAAVGFTSLTGVATLGAVVFLSGIRRAQREEGDEHGLEKAAWTRCVPWSWPAWPRVSDCCRPPSPADRCAGAAAAGARRRRRNGHHRLRHPLRHAAAGPPLLIARRIRPRRARVAPLEEKAIRFFLRHSNLSRRRRVHLAGQSLFFAQNLERLF